MSNANWIFKNGPQSIDCPSFPYAFRTMYNTLRKNGSKVNVNDLYILGPKNGRGERDSYSYQKAKLLAEDQGLINLEGQLNSREFRKR